MIKGQVFDSPPDFRGIAKGVSRSMGVGPPFSKGRTTTLNSCYRALLKGVIQISLVHSLSHHSRTHSLTHSLTHPLTHSLSLALTHSLHVHVNFLMRLICLFSYSFVLSLVCSFLLRFPSTCGVALAWSTHRHRMVPHSLSSSHR